MEIKYNFVVANALVSKILCLVLKILLIVNAYKIDIIDKFTYKLFYIYL